METRRNIQIINKTKLVTATTLCMLALMIPMDLSCKCPIKLSLEKKTVLINQPNVIRYGIPYIEFDLSKYPIYQSILDDVVLEWGDYNNSTFYMILEERNDHRYCTVIAGNDVDFGIDYDGYIRSDSIICFVRNTTDDEIPIKGDDSIELKFFSKYCGTPFPFFYDPLYVTYEIISNDKFGRIYLGHTEYTFSE